MASLVFRRLFACSVRSVWGKLLPTSLIPELQQPCPLQASFHQHTALFATSQQVFPTKPEVLEQVNREISVQSSAGKVFAVVHISGRQFKITNDDIIVVNRIPADVGTQIVLGKTLLAGSENFTLVGTPLLSAGVAEVLATVIEHTRTAKVIVFKKKRRKNYKRKKGHRQDVSVLRINSIALSPELH